MVELLLLILGDNLVTAAEALDVGSAPIAKEQIESALYCVEGLLEPIELTGTWDVQRNQILDRIEKRR